MFEALAARVERRARDRARLLEAEIARQSSPGVWIEAAEAGVRLAGPRSALRWIMAGLKR